MKEKILFLVLGMVITLFLSATVMEDFMIVKPAAPKHTVAYVGKKPRTFTLKYAKQGYVVISSASQGYHNTYVVMVKY